MVFDYRNEAYLMICSFETHRDFKMVDPYNYGFTEDYIRGLDVE